MDIEFLDELPEIRTRRDVVNDQYSRFLEALQSNPNLWGIVPKPVQNKYPAGGKKDRMRTNNIRMVLNKKFGTLGFQFAVRDNVLYGRFIKR